MEIEYLEAKSILTSINEEKGKYWFNANYNLNIYRGCHHGCIYCDSRSKVYGVTDFDKVKPKKDALLILERELKSKRKKGIIAMGAMSDPYNKLEEHLELTREALKLFDRYGFGVILATKSDLVVRDIDVLQSISRHSPVLIKMTITCVDDKLAKLIEPNVCSSSQRFAALKKLHDANINAGILLMPVLPFITDTKENISGIMEKAHEARVCFVYPGLGVTQRTGQREYYLTKLEEFSVQLRISHERRFGNIYNCPARNKKELAQLIQSLGKKYQIKTRMKDIIDYYQKGYRSEQITLF